MTIVIEYGDSKSLLYRKTRDWGNHSVHNDQKVRKKSAVLSKTEAWKPEKLQLKKDKTHTSQKSIHNYIGIISCIDSGNTRRTAEKIIILAPSYVTLMSLIGDTVVSLSDKLH